MKTQPIVWAIDPNQNNPKIWNQSQEMAKSATRSFRYSLQPVFVLDRGLFPSKEPTESLDTPTVVQRSKTQLEKMLKPLALKKILEPRLLLIDACNTEAEVRLLNQCAVTSKTPLVIAATNARSGVRRYLEGSFSETLVKFSKAPVLLVNPKCQVNPSLKRILFATDFSKMSHIAFRKVFVTARAAKAQIEIINVLPDLLYWSDMGAPIAVGTQTYIHSDFFQQDIRNAKRKGAALVKLAKRNGVKCTFYLDEKPSRSVSDAIAKRGKSSDADMIAIAARGDTSKMHFFGSTAQLLIRTSPLPVWIYHHTSKQ